MEVEKKFCWVLLAACAFYSSVFANESAKRDSTKAASLDVNGAGFNGVASAVRKGRRLQMVPSQNARAQQYVTTPRFYAAIESVGCLGRPDIKVKVHPEPTRWRVQWDSALPKDGELVITFVAAPLLVSEQQRVGAAPDGSLLLRACEARTRGENLRYEPQPYKNTVGFWVEQTDSAVWECHIPESGWYSVALLQGCGKGQGGSKGRIAFIKDGEECDSTSCVVKETGHFQNFNWVQSGHVLLEEGGNYDVSVQPIEIKQKAFGDIRAVSIVRQQKQLVTGN